MTARKTLLIAAGFGWLLLPASAAARPTPVVVCRYDSTLVPGSSGGINHLRIRQATARVDNYLSRCQVASFVADSTNGRRIISLHGAHWYIGTFRCTYVYKQVPGRDEIVIHTRCEHRGRYASIVWFDSYG